MTAPRAKPGRPRSSAGWRTVGVRVALPTAEEFAALPEDVKAKARREMRDAIDRAVGG